MANHSRRTGQAWAIAGGLVLVIGIVALIVGNLLSTPPSQAPTSTPTPGTTPSTSTPPTDGLVVDESVAERGWVPEPVTTDAETYVRAALTAAGTFDTTLSSYEEWIAYLGTWFTPDTRYTTEEDRQAELDAAKLEMRQGVVLPEIEWDSLANENGRVTAVTEGDVVPAPVPQDASGDMTIGTADVTLTFTRADNAGNETSYDETARVSVQVLCGPESIPVPDSPQQPGDCKIVRFFTETVEP